MYVTFFSSQFIRFVCRCRENGEFVCGFLGASAPPIFLFGVGKVGGKRGKEDVRLRFVKVVKGKRGEGGGRGSRSEPICHVHGRVDVTNIIIHTFKMFVVIILGGFLWTFAICFVIMQ